MDEEFGDDFEPTVVEDDEEAIIENVNSSQKPKEINDEEKESHSQQTDQSSSSSSSFIDLHSDSSPSSSNPNSNPNSNSISTTTTTTTTDTSQSDKTSSEKFSRSPRTSTDSRKSSKTGFFYDVNSNDSTSSSSSSSSSSAADDAPVLFMNSPFGMIQAFLRKNKCKDMDEVRLRREERVRASMVTWRAWRDAVPQIRDIKAHVLSRAAYTKLWWQGIPTNLRSYFWMKALDNTLNVTKELYSIMLLQSKSKLSSTFAEQKNILFSTINNSREQASTLIRSDVPRTFALLQFFKAGGPYHDSLSDVLEAYVCYRPDLGYVQGMTYLAATALLNLESAGDAFIFVANMLNSPVQRGFYAMDAGVIGKYSRATTACLRAASPKLARRLEDMGISPDMYIVEWVMTVFSKVLPLDVAVHVWDMWLLEGDYFIFRTVVGLLSMYSEFLLLLRFEDIMRFLRNLPQDIIDEALFESIAAVPLNAKKFQAILDKC